MHFIFTLIIIPILVNILLKLHVENQLSICDYQLNGNSTDV